MWSLVALESIPIGSYLFDYTGEIIDDNTAENRAAIYDNRGFNYLYDMKYENSEEDLSIRQSFTIDACFFGNESRFVNHSCQPNAQAIIMHSSFKS